MKSLISAFAVAAVMGIAAAATPASAADLSAEVVITTTVPTGANNCVVVNDGHHNFGEQVCTRKYPWWYTPVRYKNHNGGNFQYDNTDDKPDHYCPPKKHEYSRDYPKHYNGNNGNYRWSNGGNGGGWNHRSPT